MENLYLFTIGLLLIVVVYLIVTNNNNLFWKNFWKDEYFAEKEVSNRAIKIVHEQLGAEAIKEREFGSTLIYKVTCKLHDAVKKGYKHAMDNLLKQ